MRKANMLYYHDLSEMDGIVDICENLKNARENDTIENYKLILKYIYNHLRNIFETENAIQLAYTEDMSKVFLLVYDCLASELKDATNSIVTETETYIEY